MSPPTLILLLVTTACAALAHILWGRRWLQIPIFWLAAFAGCLIVYVSGVQLPANTPKPANVPLLEVIVGAWMLLFVASKLRL